MVRRFMLAVCCIALVFAAYTPARAAAPIRLQFAGYHPPVHMVSVLMTNFCDEVNKRSAAR